MRWLELKIPPVIVGFAFAGAMFGATRIAPGLAFVLPARLAFTLGLVALGLTVSAAGVIAFRTKGTTVNPLTPGASSTVVRAGVYRASRNPMYLGFLLVLVGWALHLSNAAAFLLLPAFVAFMTRFQIKPEERALLAKFGPEFAQYTAHVRRWI